MVASLRMLLHTIPEVITCTYFPYRSLGTVLEFQYQEILLRKVKQLVSHGFILQSNVGCRAAGV